MTSFDKAKLGPGCISDKTTMGITSIGDYSVQIALWRPGATECALHIYADGRRYTYPMYPATEAEMPDFFTLCMEMDGITDILQGQMYDFEADGEHFIDVAAREITGRSAFGKKPGKIRGRFDFRDFDWTDEHWQRLSQREMIIYQCHVRGFTKHASSGVAHPGTFLGLVEKIPYLLDLGVNTLLLQPIYDFDEKIREEDGTDTGKINYWGYTKDAYYFAPKAGYATGETSPAYEFYQLVKALHEHGMNIILDMYFPDQAPEYVVSCLRYYALRFHVDGFKLHAGSIDVDQLRVDPVISHCLLLGGADPDFLITARRFLKSDEGQAEAFCRHFRAQADDASDSTVLVHGITMHDGFTLQDLVSYDMKHNEANGERNRDGADYNYSWNCGAEGPSRKKEVLRKRTVQRRNAYAMVLLGMATPMLLAGDEFANTQKGNNNAYCQDNLTTWLDWRELDKHTDTYDFVKALIAFRKVHPLYHTDRKLTGMDTQALGAPDVSVHGREPWETTFTHYTREIALMYYGGYYGGESLYFAFNLHWESHEFFLPSLGPDKGWRMIFDTSGEHGTPESLDGAGYVMEPRSIVVFVSTTLPKATTKSKKKKK